MNKSFLQVDVFTSQPLRGNPAAVVFDADDLDARTMQRIARELNLSETVFVLAPESPDTDYRVRIFTPSSELPFAGHPTIATASAVRAHRGDLADASLLRQACGIGIVPVEVVPTESSPIYWMTQASPQFRSTAIGPGEMSALLGCDANTLAAMPVEVVSTGIPWLIAELRSVAALSSLRPNLPRIAERCRASGAVGVTVFAEHEADAPVRLRLRTFAPGEGVAEDPVCGSGNGCVAAFLARHRHASDLQGGYLAEQGIEMGRDGLIHVEWTRNGEELTVRVGGQAVTVASGTLHL